MKNPNNQTYEIPFNKPIILDSNVIVIPKGTSGDNYYTKEVTEWLNRNLNTNSLLTTSCTHALEIISLLLDIKDGDEIIAPSYTFVSTVNAFALRGAKIKFIDIDPFTMNLDENLIESAINANTKAIVVVHYAGVSCNMEKVARIAKKYNIFLVEDAAQALMAKYNDKYLGTIGDFGAISFHETKNFSMGEGGALLINNKKFYGRAEIIREKGTDRSRFLKGYVDKYTWVDLGSSYLPSDILASYLYPQLLRANEIIDRRMIIWNEYYLNLKHLEHHIGLPFIPNYAKHNAHIFYIKCSSESVRIDLIEHLKHNGIMSIFHYIPLHSSPAGKIYGDFIGTDVYTSSESLKILRLPLYYNLDDLSVKKVIFAILDFYKANYNE